MSLLAAIIDWDRPDPDVRGVGSLLSALPSRCPDGRFFARAPGAAMGIGKLVVRKAERAEIQPLRDDRRGVCAVGVLRFDNREDLRRSIGEDHHRQAPTTDIQLLLAGYERWGEGIVDRLVGDFAFVLWDWRERRILAARDPFGVRPLVYWNAPGRTVFASDAGQLLALPEVDRAADPQTVADSLSWSYAHYGRTFFRDIRSVHPGHFMEVRANGLREIHYFQPPSTPTHHPRAEDYREQFRDLFRQSVEDRMDSDYGIVAHLSGGLDSSSIVCQADRLCRSRPGVHPPVTIASALFPGHSHDELPYIDAVCRSVQFPSRRFDGNVPSGWEFSRPALGIPGASVLFNGGSVGDLEVARATNSRVVLSGEAGDFVTGEMGLFDDLLRGRRWGALYSQIAVAGSGPERRARLSALKKSIREIAPRPLMWLWDLKNSTPSAHPPAWLNRDLREMWVDRRAWRPPAPRRWLSGIQRGAWAYLVTPRMAWTMDHAATYASEARVEFRFPFLDLRLVRFVLSIPFEHRLAGPLPRWFHRQALRPLLPDAIVDRSSKPGFTQAVVEWGRRSRPAIERVVGVGNREWRSGDFVDRPEVQKLLGLLASRAPNRVADWDDWRAIRSIVNIEVWRRAVLEYSTDQEALPMSEVSPPNKATSSETSEEAFPMGSEQQRQGTVIDTQKVPTYVAPKLTSVGNVNQLLASSPPSGGDLSGTTAGATPP